MLTDNFLKKCLNTLGGLATSTSCYLALSKTEPTSNGQGVVEPIGNGYERILLNSSSSSSSSSSSHMEITEENVLTNKDIVYLGEATGDWGTLNYYCLYDSKSGGNLMAYGSLSSPITINAGVVPLIRAGEISITISRGE